MLLTRAFLNPKSREVLQDIRDPESLHKRLMRAFPSELGPSPRQSLALLHRLERDGQEGRCVLLIQSAVEPELMHLPEDYLATLEVDAFFSDAPQNPATRKIDRLLESITGGQAYAFRLRANPTRKIDTKTREDSRRRHGRRVPCRGDEERLRWLRRKASSSGFDFAEDAVRTEEEPVLASSSGKTFAGVRFDGLLRVTDAEQLRKSVVAGIGPAKAYGFGLLSLRPV